MILTIDTGNTNTVFGMFHQGSLLYKWRFPTDPKIIEDQLYAFLSPILKYHQISVGSLRGIIISSVVPALIFPLTLLADRYFALEPIILGSKDFQHDIFIKLDSPKSLGTDLLANSAGALTLFDCDHLIIDLCTTTTFTVCTKERNFISGAIAPGIDMALYSLSEGTAQLPPVSFCSPKSSIGENTSECIQSGIYFGYIVLVREIVQCMIKEFQYHLKIIATGGLAHKLASAISEIDEVVADLTLIGLEYLNYYNIHHREKKYEK